MLQLQAVCQSVLPITSTHISLIAGFTYAEHAVLCLQPRAPVPYVMHNAIKSVF